MRVSGHLEHMADMIAAVEGTVATLCHKGPEKAPPLATLETLQNLDFLRQYAEDLALLLLLLGRLDSLDVLPARMAMDLANRVRLERTRALLIPNAETVLADPSGDVDLF